MKWIFLFLWSRLTLRALAGDASGIAEVKGTERRLRQAHSITICATIDRAEPILPEWIEFHSLQGVTQFVFYQKAASFDSAQRHANIQMELFKEFYGPRNRSLTIHYLNNLDAAAGNINNFRRGHDKQNDAKLQHLAFRHCLAQYSTSSEWVMFLNVKDFVWSPSTLGKITTAQFLDTLATELHRRTRLRVSSATTSLHPAQSDALAAEAVRYLLNQTTGRWSQGNITCVPLQWSIPVVPMSGGGALFDPNVFMARNPVTTRAELHFDPKDHWVIQKAWTSNSTGQPVNPLLRLDANHRMKLRLNDYWDDQALAELQLLTDEDFTKWTHDSKSFDEFLKKHWLGRETTLLTSEVPPDYWLNTTENTHFSASWLSALQAQTGSRKKREDGLDELHSLFSRGWSRFFPSVIERGVYRPPLDFLGEDLEQKRERIRTLFPECGRFLDLLADLGKTLSPLEALQEARLKEVPSDSTCSVSYADRLFVDEPHIGKFAVWTGPLNYTHSSRTKLDENLTSSELALKHFLEFAGGKDKISPQRCRQTFDSFSGQAIAPLDPVFGLRINHYLSPIIRPTNNYEDWKSNFLKSFSPSVRAHEQYMSSIKNDRARTLWLQDLKNNLARLLPKADTMSGHTMHKFDSSGIVIQTNAIRKCSLIDVLTEARVMCPPEYPVVGFSMPKGVVPPSTAVLGSWCVNSTESTNIEFYSPGVPVSCPGFPETSCCDYEESYAPLQPSAYRSRPAQQFPGRWKLPSICVDCESTN